MSTNPFRQIDRQQNAGDDSSSAGPLPGNIWHPDELFIDTKVRPGSVERHVSFASPPVDGTIAAASYPSSPESARNLPPSQIVQPGTPNYRSAFFSDPFSDLTGDKKEDKALIEALQNKTSNLAIGEDATQRVKEDAVKDTLSRFAHAPKSPNRQQTGDQDQRVPSRQSMDVNAFARLLMTGNTGHAGSSAGGLDAAIHPMRSWNDSSSGTDTASISHQSVFDQTAPIDCTPRSSHEIEREEKPKVPPPTPAPRRGKSVKHKDVAEKTGLASSKILSAHADADRAETIELQPATSQLHPSLASTTMSKSGHTPPPPPAPPPPPPMRRHNSSARRRSSSELETAAEEVELTAPVSSTTRRFSNDRPPPPPSRNSSSSVKRQSVGLMHPPPLPPPRRGRGSSRSSMDSFRPSLSSIMGDAEGGSTGTSNHSGQAFDTRDVLAELARLQAEVDEARRTA